MEWSSVGCHADGVTESSSLLDGGAIFVRGSLEKLTLLNGGFFIQMHQRGVFTGITGATRE